MDFLHHIVKYFRPEEGEEPPERTVKKERRAVKIQNELIPVYKKGRLVRYIEADSEEDTNETKEKVNLAAQEVKTSKPNQEVQPASEDLYRLRPDGTLERVAPSRPLALTPSNTTEGKQSEPSKTLPTSETEATITWDCWPDGNFEADLSWDEYKETGQLMIHWASKGNGGYRKGDDQALHWEGGKKSRRTCLGAIKCDNDLCQVVIRPLTDAEKIHEQLRRRCKCGAVLKYQQCNTESFKHKWLHGVHFQHRGFHTHLRPTHILHLSPKERRDFEEIVYKNPNSGPVQLIVGVPGLRGPGASVADISDVLLNKDRVAKERQKIKRSETVTPEKIFKSIGQFAKDNKGFVVRSVLEEETVISLQTPFMRSQLVKDSRLEDNVNGTVNDAAHGWWKDRNSLLLVSSTYCPVLHYWVPGIISYSNGATERHFQHHFFAAMISIAQEAEERGIPVEDNLFAGVMDFSQAERGGFILAFIEFWMDRKDNTRTRQELQTAAERLLKGCREHYRTNVTRISRISGVVPPDMADEFVKRALALLDAPDSESFIKHAERLVRDFPKTKPWMSWWMRPTVASMLFESARKMDIDIWESIPDDNNAEESMHWRLYQFCGRNHELIEGLYALHTVAGFFKRQFDNENKGGKGSYGQNEPFKAVSKRFEHTKKTRIQQGRKSKKKNDGRPPDTIKELLLNPKSKKSSNAKTEAVPEPKQAEPLSKPAESKAVSQISECDSVVKGSKKTSGSKVVTFSDTNADTATSADNPTSEPLTVPIPSYPWHNNSCWLDSSLQLLYTASVRFPAEFNDIQSTLPEKSPLKFVFETFRRRQGLDIYDSRTPKILGWDRNEIRKKLRHAKIIQSLSNYESLFVSPQSIISVQNLKAQKVWFAELVRLEDPTKCPRARAAFEVFYTDVHSCSGSSKTGGPHIEIRRAPRRGRILQLSASDHAKFDGKLIQYFKDFVALDQPITSNPCCWRTKDGVPQCNGTRTDIKSIVTSIPFILTFEVGHELRGDRSSSDVYDWDFPLSLPVGLRSNTFNRTHGLFYDIIGFGLVNIAGNHFIARFGSDDQTTVYTYDDMADGGDLKEETGASYRTHMSGPNIRLPEGFVIYQVFYALRGGFRAQQAFYQHRSKEISSKYGVSFSSTQLDQPITTTLSREGFIRLNDVDCDWKSNPYKSPTIEYISTSLMPAEPSQELESPGPESEEDMEPSVTNALAKSPSPEISSGQHCRCGILARGSDIDQYGDCIQCNQCKGWSHIACHTDGRASNPMAKKLKFVCDNCIPQNHFFGFHYSKKELASTRDKNAQKRLINRLRIGSGALVRLNDFWYPVRIIRKVDAGWVVRWWRGNKLISAEIPLHQSFLVKLPDITDSLWHQKDERRKIRLGFWTRSIDIEDPEDILLDPSSTPYSDDVDKALAPFKDTLKSLVFPDIETPANAIIPAQDWLKSIKKPSATTLVPYSGPLSITERAQIANWFDTHVTAKDKKLWIASFGLLPLAHAFTLFIAHKLSLDPDLKDRPSEELIRLAWEHQYSDLPPRVNADVDLEALRSLERQMFEVSAEAGDASCYQWGLDAGHHQDNWYPYSSVWDVGDFKGDDSILRETGPDFIDYIEPQKTTEEEEPKKPQPRPRPRPKKKDN